MKKHVMTVTFYKLFTLKFNRCSRLERDVFYLRICYINIPYAYENNLLKRLPVRAIFPTYCLKIHFDIPPFIVIKYFDLIDFS